MNMTARSLSPTTQRGEATRQKVLEAAETVFGEKGYHGASVTEITRAAGVAQGTFYLYFKGKKEIFLDLVDALGSRLRILTLDASSGAETYAEAQRLGFSAFFDFARTHRHIYRIIPECDRVDPITYRRFYSQLAEAYRRGQAEAGARGEAAGVDPEVVAYCMLGIGHFVALRFLFWDEALSAEAEETAIRFAQKGVRPD
ncbi:MAG TPA: TetR/AcrR family transcriptional regulator [Candidatus Dormibacteraeota bacterium]|jgi:AcrR family transcriptional regulator|nr:TetR/AcrR family transcriptional regulator [Candidatus Dormibacteraeota bacterium]